MERRPLLASFRPLLGDLSLQSGRSCHPDRARQAGLNCRLPAVDKSSRAGNVACRRRRADAIDADVITLDCAGHGLAVNHEGCSGDPELWEADPGKRVRWGRKRQGERGRALNKARSDRPSNGRQRDLGLGDIARLRLDREACERLQTQLDTPPKGRRSAWRARSTKHA